MLKIKNTRLGFYDHFVGPLVWFVNVKAKAFLSVANFIHEFNSFAFDEAKIRIFDEAHSLVK